MAAIFDFVMDKMDVVTAFLYGYLEENIYKRQHVGFEFKDKERKLVLSFFLEFSAE